MSKSKLPILTSVGVCENQDTYACFTLKSQGNKIIEKRVIEFDSKSDALDHLKAQTIKIFWHNQE